MTQRPDAETPWPLKPDGCINCPIYRLCLGPTQESTPCDIYDNFTEWRTTIKLKPS